MKLLERMLLPLLISIPVVFTGVVTLAPQPVRLMDAWAKAELYETNDQGEKAVPYFQTILEYQPERVDLWERIGTIEFRAGNFPDAVAAYTHASTSKAITTDGLFNLGSANLQMEDVKSASAVWLQLAEREDIDAERLASMTRQLRSAGDLESALIAAKRWHEVDPQSTQAAWTAGLLQAPHDAIEAATFLAAASSGEPPEVKLAVQLMETLAEAAVQPNPAYRQVLIGQQLADIGQWDVAEAALDEAVRLDPEYAEAWALLGEVQQKLGKDGWNALLRAKTLNPESDMVVSALVLYWKRQEKFEVALAYIHKLAARYPDEGSWQLEIGNTLVQSGDVLSAMDAYQRATEIEPDDPQNWQTLAVFSATYGFDAEAFSIPAITRALDLAPDDPSVLDAAGWVYLTIGQLEKAEQFLQLALEEDGDFSSAKLHLAQVYIESNRLSKALPLLKEAAAHTEDSTTAMVARRLLEKYFPGQ